MYKWQVGTSVTPIPVWMEKYNLDPIIFRILETRGLSEEAEVEKFLFPDLDRDEHDPYLLSGMSTAIDRLKYALAKGERIMIHGDYDADGITSTALMTKALRSHGADVVPFIPSRDCGYGLQQGAVSYALENKVSLIITVDCGITSFEEVRFASLNNIDIIITDHHSPPEVLPEACAIINPKLATCSYPFKDLAGVGVAYKLLQALLGTTVRELLPLVAIGSIGDLVPLRGENRLFCWEGLRRLNATPDNGIAALIQVAGLTGQEITASHVGYALAPRLNAAGRLTTADLPLQLLLSSDESFCTEAAQSLDILNRERQEVEAKVVEEAIALSSSQDPAIVLYAPQWHHGVVGIAASRLVEKYYRPTILLGRDEDGLLRGSGRSIAGFNLVEALRKCEHFLERCGGHAMAAGLSLREENFPAFAAAFAALADAIPSDALTREIRIDSRIDLDSLTESWVTGLQLLAPFGIGNANPTFCAKGLAVSEKRIVGRNRDHLRLVVRDQKSSSFAGIMFGQAARLDEVKENEGICIAFRPTVEEYRGRPQISLRLQDFYPHSEEVYWLISNPNLADSYFSQLTAEFRMRFFQPLNHFSQFIIKKDRGTQVLVTLQDIPPEEKPVLLTPPLGELEQRALESIDYLPLDGLVYNSEEIMKDLVPDRAALATFYRMLSANSGQLSLDEYAVSSPSPCAAAYSSARSMLDIFTELELLKYRVSAQILSYELVKGAPKRELTDSPTYLALSTWRRVN